MSYTVLTIEDNEEMCANIASILELARYKVLTARNGKEGVALAQQHIPDLILCDIMMPELDGFAVLHILSKDPETAGIPFIYLTAKTSNEDFRSGMNLGADDYIFKPFDGSELLKVVETRLRKHHFVKSSFGRDIDGLNSFLNEARQLRELEKLSLSKHSKMIHKKEFLFMEGLSPNDVYFLQSGEIKTYKSSPDGKELITGLHKAGDFVGYLPLLENTPYNESAVALTDSEIYLIPKDDFMALLYSNRSVAIKFIKMITNNLLEAERRLVEMAYHSVRQRVAGSLLMIFNQMKADQMNGVITISRKDIASIVGTATESLNRTLADLKEEKLIELNDSGIRLLDRDRLSKIAM